MMKLDSVNKISRSKQVHKQRSTLKSVGADFISSQKNAGRAFNSSSNNDKNSHGPKADPIRRVWLISAFGIIAVLGIWALSLQSNIQRISQEKREDSSQQFQELELVRDSLKTLLSDTSQLFDNLKVATSSAAALEQDPVATTTEALSPTQLESLIKNIDSELNSTSTVNHLP